MLFLRWMESDCQSKRATRHMGRAIGSEYRISFGTGSASRVSRSEGAYQFWEEVANA